MKQNRINVLYVVIDYVKDLFSGSAVALENRDRNKDAKALMYLSFGNVFYTSARNGREYLYCFIPNKSDVNVARHILRANGMNPNLHLSHYYNTPMLALRTPVKEIAENDQAQRLADRLMVERSRISFDKDIVGYVKQLRQNTK